MIKYKPIFRIVSLIQLRSFNKVVKQIELLAKSGAEVNPENFYPPVKKHRGKSRYLPLVDIALREALNQWLKIRLLKVGKLAPSSPLFVTQKGGSYSPNTLQEQSGCSLS